MQALSNSNTEAIRLAALRVRLRQRQQALTADRELFPHQMPPGWDWDTWVILGGRGSGKTEAGARFVLDFLRRSGRVRVGVGAPIISDARDVCAEGETGLITLAPGEFRYNRSLGEAYHRNGGYVKFLGSEESARWNGPQWHLLWADELGLWNEDSWDQAQFGVRLGEHPQVLVTTTPKNRKFIKKLAEHPRSAVTRATTYDNPALAKRVLESFEERYGGTRLGRQELLAEFIEEIEGALWQMGWIDNNRVTQEKADQIGMSRIVVAVDPAVTHGAESNETGIGVVARGNDGQYYILAAQGFRLSPSGWAQKVIDFYDTFQAERVIAERNNGGEMVESTIRAMRPDISLKTIVASRGKVLRAEPVAALYEQGRVHHVGILQALEEQLTTFPVANELDDLVDVAVYGISELLPEPPGARDAVVIYDSMRLVGSVDIR